MITIGLVGGSGLLKSKLDTLQNLKEEYVDTPLGRVVLRTGKINEFANLVFVQRHDAQASRAYTQPADINYGAIALALKQRVSKILALFDSFFP
jgi:purine nucleoside phosphorylase